MDYTQRIMLLAQTRGITTYLELEERAGVSNGTLGKWAKGAYSPTMRSLNKIADCLKVSLSSLLEQGVEQHQESEKR